jgi:SNF2 family DNA or RNA helicase
MSPTESTLALRLAAALQAPLDRLLAPDGALEWPASLLPFQQDGVALLVARRELLLADDMGLGKTIQAAAAMRVLFHRREITRSLVVCPASLLRQWERELSVWTPELRVVTVSGDPAQRGTLWRIPAHIRLVGYETLRADVLDLADSPVVRSSWDLVVLDEAQRIKNRETGISLACKRIPCERRWALTGTPLENRVEDILSILEFLVGDRGAVSLPCGAAGLRDLLANLQLRRKKGDVLPDLPPKQIVDVELELAPAQREAYERAEREGVVRLSEAGPSVTVTHVLELITRLKQLCNFEPVTGESAKAEDTQRRMGELAAEGHRALVFSQFTDSVYGVGSVLRCLEEYRPLSLTGAMSASDRVAAVDRFVQQPRHKALVLSLRAGGVGLNLQAASYVFHLDRWWNPAVEDQAESRAHRFGQYYPVTVYRYTCLGTIEERIAQKLEEKRRLFREVVDDVTMDLRTALTEEELFGLFGLTPPRGAAMKDPGAGTSFGSLSGVEFEQWVAERLGTLGYRVSMSPATRDGGVDLHAERQDELGMTARLIIQCKSQTGPVGVRAVRELRGVATELELGAVPVIASPSGFTSDARQFADRTGVRLWGRQELNQLTVAAPDLKHGSDQRGFAR